MISKQTLIERLREETRKCKLKLNGVSPIFRLTVQVELPETIEFKERICGVCKENKVVSYNDEILECVYTIASTYNPHYSNLINCLNTDLFSICKICMEKHPIVGSAKMWLDPANLKIEIPLNPAQKILANWVWMLYKVFEELNK